jgi:16S rRNA processing protein RimM
MTTPKENLVLVGYTLKPYGLLGEMKVRLVLVGYTLKPYGLLGEMKVRPASFDPERHASLKRVFFRKREGEETVEAEVRASRADGEFWYLKFEGCKTPESVAHLSGGFLYVAEEDQAELPEDMVFISDLPGMDVVDELGQALGKVAHVLDQGAQELIAVRVGPKEILIPWNDHFVKRIDKEARIVHVDMTALRGLL